MTWEFRDLPVLRAIVELSENSHYLISPDEIASRVGMNERDVVLALAALAGAQPPFFEFEDCSDFKSHVREIDNIRNLSSRAREALGLWRLLLRVSPIGSPRAWRRRPSENLMRNSAVGSSAQRCGGLALAATS